MLWLNIAEIARLRIFINPPLLQLLARIGHQPFKRLFSGFDHKIKDLRDILLIINYSKEFSNLE